MMTQAIIETIAPTVLQARRAGHRAGHRAGNNETNPKNEKKKSDYDDGDDGDEGHEKKEKRNPAYELKESSLSSRACGKEGGRVPFPLFEWAEEGAGRGTESICSDTPQKFTMASCAHALLRDRVCLYKNRGPGRGRIIMNQTSSKVPYARSCESL